MRTQSAAIAVALTAIALAGCGESDAERIAAELAKSVREADRAELTDVTCEESKGSGRVWFCVGDYRKGPILDTNTEYDVSLDDDGHVERWVVAADER